jgi:hypothetical protein
MSRAQKLFQLILLAYPREFRCEFGPQMLQVFCDCYRAERKTGGPRRLWHFWLHTFWDLARTAPQEHLDNFRKDHLIMNIRRDAVAVLGCLGIIALAFLMLSYGRKNEVASILLFGYALDAIISMGVVGNLIVFLLVKTTKFNSFRIALWTFLVLHVVAAALIAIIGRADPNLRFGPIMIGYVISFLFWTMVHWAWSKSSGKWAMSGEQ